MKQSELSIILQGRYDHEITNKAIESYRKYSDNIIVSTWEHENIQVPDDVTLLVSKPFRSHTRNPGNIEFQCFTTWLALNHVYDETTPYIIKCRTDEYHGNLQPLIDKFEANKDKVVTNNVCFKFSFPQNLSDHLIMCSAGYMRIMFTRALHYMNASLPYTPYLNPEQMLTLALMQATNKPFEDLFKLVDVEELAPYIISNGGKKYTTYDTILSNCNTNMELHRKMEAFYK